MILKRKTIDQEHQLQHINYPWARKLLDQAIANTWFPNEVPLAEDLDDWRRMTDDEKNAVIMYIGFSNPMEYDVNLSIMNGMMPFLDPPELNMYLIRQEWEEVNHSLSFDYVINTLQIDRDKAFNTHVNVPSVEAKEKFLVDSIKQMESGNIDIETITGKQDFIRNVVKTNIITEGIWFYSGFMFSLSFRQRNLLKNFANITDWIARDEALHLQFGIRLILGVLEENPEIATADFAEEIRQIILHAVRLEMAYNQELIPNGILGMNLNFINQYVQYVADRRLEELGYPPHFNVPNPAKWMSTANDTLELINFFETINTNYEVNN